MAKAVLIPGKEKRVLGGHPWVFRSDIAQVSGTYEPGDVLDVVSSRGRFLGRAFYNPKSQISLRMMPCMTSPWTGTSFSAGCGRRWNTAVPSRTCTPAG